jgi:hypothetical protein
MSCALTQGYSLDCKDSVGGIKEVHFIEKANATFTFTANVVTAITLASTKHWFKYEQIKETSSFTQTFNDNVANATSFVTMELDIVIPKLATATRNEIALLAQNHLYAVVTDRNGLKWLLGYQNGVDRVGGTAAAGKAMGDLNGYTLKFHATEPVEAFEVTAALVTT